MAEKCNHLARQLYNASARGRDSEVLDLLQVGVDPNHTYYDKVYNGFTPLHNACRNNHPKSADTIVRYGGKLNKANNGRDTPLHEACFSNALDCVQVLVEHGCRTDVKNNQGKTALDLAKQEGNTAIVYFLANYQPKARDPLSVYPSVMQLSKVEVRDLFRLGLQLGLSEHQLLTATRNRQNQIKDLYLLCKENGVNAFYKDIMQALIAIGENEAAETICIQQGEGHSGVSLSVYFGWLDFLKFLIETRGEDPKGVVNKDGQTPLSVAFARGHMDIVKYLVREHKCNPKDCLLYAAEHNLTYEVDFLLDVCHSDPNVKNDADKSPLTLTNDPDIIKLLLKHGAKAENVYKAHSKQIGKLSSERPPDNPLPMLITGNGGAGKSTWFKAVLNSKGLFAKFWKAKPVSGVDEKTVGIIPYRVFTKELGEVLCYDFAGQPEFFASHCAVLENAVQTSSPIIIFCANLQDSEKKIIDSTLYWMTLLQNQCGSLKENAHVIVVGSHADKLIENREDPRAKEGIFAPIIEKFPKFNFIAFVPMDCRFPDTDQMKEVKKHIQYSSASLRSPETVSLNAHSFYIYLLDSFKDELAVSLKDVQKKIHSDLDQARSKWTQNLLSFIPNTLPRIIEICQQLSKKGHILFLPNESSPEESFIVCDRPTLLSRVTGTVFAPEGFRQHCSLASSTGVVPLFKFSEAFKGYNIEMLIAFMSLLELCFEIKDKQVLDHIVKLEQKSSEATVTSPLHSLDGATAFDHDSRYLFFPGLIRIEVPEQVWEQAPDLSYHFGWLLQCSQDIQFFDPRCLQVLILRLVFTFGLAPASRIQRDIPSLQRFCSVWKNGICWCNEDGITSHLELSDHGRSFALKIRSRVLKPNCLILRSKIIKKVLETVQEFCPSIESTESVIDPQQVIEHPLKPSCNLALSNITDIATAVVCNNEDVKSMYRPLSLQQLLKFEPYAGLDQNTLQHIHSLKNPAKDESISNAFISHFAKQVADPDRVRLYRRILTPSQTITSSEASQSGSSSQELIDVLESWRKVSNGTYSSLRETLNECSIFTGRNPLNLAGVPHSDCDSSMFSDSPSQDQSDVLNVDKHLRLVREATWELRAKWYHLGVELEVTAGTLDVIKQDNDSTDDRFTGLLKHWLSRSSPPPTWFALIEAIRSPPVGYGDLAMDIEAMLAK